MTSPLPDRRKPPVRCRPWLAVVAAVLALVVYFKDARAEQVKGLTRNGSAYVCEMKPPYPLLRFCVMFTRERR